MDLAIDQRGVGNRWSLTAGLAGLGIRPVTHVSRGSRVLARRRAGRIVIENASLEAVYGRWWPHSGDLLSVCWDTNFRPLAVDRCELFYNRAAGFLTLSYVRSGPRTSLSTLYAATLVLDEIARITETNAIVCHVTNARISDRLLKRWGWQPHCLQWSGRHFIKRFYGRYPEIPLSWRQRLTLA